MNPTRDFKPLLAALSLLVSAELLLAQSPPNKTSNSRKEASRTAQDLKINNLIVLGETAPPEVSADLLLTLSASSLITDPARKKEAIEDAYRIASAAREPVKRRAWTLMVDTRSGLKQAAFDLELDRLSLQSKAVTQMIPLDPLRARMMFQEMSVPVLKSLACEDTLGYDVYAYYRTALAVAEHCFDENERKAHAHIQFLSDRLEVIKSVPQVVAAARMILDAEVSPEQFTLLVNTLAGALERVPTDARLFAFAIGRDGLAFRMHGLLLKSKQLGVPNDLSNAVRRFLIKQMSDEVCVDATWLNQRQIKFPADFVRLNAEFSRPITDDDVQPLKLGPPAAEVVYWTTPRAKQLLMLARDLRFGGDDTELTLEQRQTDEWRKKLLDYLDLIDSWPAESEASPDDYFKQKCILYDVMADLCPDDALRDVVLRAYESYLKETDREYKGRIEWIFPIKEYLRRLQSTSEAERRKSLDSWLTSSDAALRVYAELSLLSKK